MYNKLIEAAHKFLRKVDTGQARSTETYNELTDALGDPRILAYKAIDSEREYQETKWTGHEHEVGAYITMLDFYVAEAKKGWVKNSGDAAALESIRKIAGIAVACMEAHGAPERHIDRKSNVETTVSDVVLRSQDSQDWVIEIVTSGKRTGWIESYSNVDGYAGFVPIAHISDALHFTKVEAESLALTFTEKWNNKAHELAPVSFIAKRRS